MPKVSFILPAYKRTFLHEAIASILAQTCRDFELVVVDDCSPENLKEVVDEFHDERLSYHRNVTNLGGKDLIAAWNHAMESARGEWCVIASDDDVYHPEYLAEMIRLSEKYPACDVFHCRICMINGEGKVIHLGAPRGEYETPAEMLYNTAIARIDLRAPDILFRKSVWQKYNGFFQSPRAWYSDIGSWVMFSREHGAACSPRILFNWRESGVNISNEHKDAVEKIRAGFEFRDWLKKQIECVKIEHSGDVLYLDMARSSAEASIYGIMSLVMRRAPFSAWYKAMRTYDFPRQLRRMFINDRIKRIILRRVN